VVIVKLAIRLVGDCTGADDEAEVDVARSPAIDLLAARWLSAFGSACRSGLMVPTDGPNGRERVVFLPRIRRHGPLIASVK